MSSENSNENERASITKQLGDRFRRHRAPAEQGGAVAAKGDEGGEQTVIAMVEGPRKGQPKVIPEHPTSGVKALPLADILDSPYQPRKRILSKHDVRDLMGAIAAVGQITPVLVTASTDQPGKYVVHSGHRRCAALRFLGATTVLAIVREGMDERSARKLVVGDNIGREDLSAYEQAIALRDYAKTFEVGFEEAGQELGIQARTAYRLKSLLAASDDLQALVREHGIAAKPADILAKLEGTNKRRALRVAEQYASGTVGIAEIEKELRGVRTLPRRPAFVPKIEFVVSATGAVLDIAVDPRTITADQRQRVLQKMGEFLRWAGMDAVEPAERPEGIRPE